MENGPRIDALIAEARSDNSRLGRLLEAYRPFLLLMAQSEIGVKLAVRCAPEDAVQQTVTNAVQAFPAFHGTSEPEFSAWIKRIHRNTVADVLRRHSRGEKRSIKRERRLDDTDGTASICVHEPVADQTSPSQKAIQGENALRLARVLQSLPLAQRDAIRLRYLEAWPVERIAEELERSLAATAGLIKRGLKALREHMSAESWQ